jgi:polyketide biosynthesis acyl carrier protein
MNKEQIRQVVMKNIRDVLFDLDVQEIPIDASLKDLGANSMDRADIVAHCLEDLQLEMPLVELRTAGNIDGLVNLLYQKIQCRASRPGTAAKG